MQRGRGSRGRRVLQEREAGSAGGETVSRQRDAVITGVGVVSALGVGAEEFWRALIRGERGIRRITRFDPTGLRNEKAGEVVGFEFDSAEFGLAAEPDLATQFALTAASEALDDAGIQPGALGSRRCGAVLATNFGGADRWEPYVQSFLDGLPDPAAFDAFLFDAAARAFLEAFSLGGPVRVLSLACSSGTVAIGLAADLVRAGLCDVCLAGGHDCLALTPLAGLSALRTITPDDIRPFSANRSGTLFGEGAAYVVVEEAEMAERRGATVYGRIAGWWQNNNGYHLTAPDPDAEGLRLVIEACLRRAGWQPEAVDYINAHGTGTEYHDPAETAAIKAVLGQRAHEIPVSSIKAATGHTMGAAGAVEAVATLLAIRDQIAPPTANYGPPDPACDLDYVPGQGRPAKIDKALSISSGIGGNNACIAFERP